MLEDFLKWMPPEQADLARKVFVELFSRIEKLEQASAPPPVIPAPQLPN